MAGMSVHVLDDVVRGAEVVDINGRDVVRIKVGQSAVWLEMDEARDLVLQLTPLVFEAEETKA